MNEVSSRSHCILTVYVEGLNKLTNLRSFGKLHLVPLSNTLQYHSALHLRLAAAPMHHPPPTASDLECPQSAQTSHKH
jgi:hypothetical protein